MLGRHYELRDPESGQVLARVAASPFVSAYESFEKAGLQLPSTCRGSTICGLCRVIVLEGGDQLPAVLADEAELLGDDGDAMPPVRLACRIKLPRGLRRLVLGGRLQGGGVAGGRV